MPTNLLILPLLGGFCFVHISHKYKFRAQHLDGYRLLLYSAVAGAVLLLFARIGIVILKQFAAGMWIREKWASFAPIPYLGTATAALVLAFVVSFALNLITNPEDARDKEISEHGNALLQLLQKAEVQDRLISVTLDNRKWYVGYVAEGPNLDPAELYFKILPVISGYRDSESLVFRRTVSYEEVLQRSDVDANDFVVTLPLADVKIANLFNPDIYKDHFAQTEDLEEGPKPEAGGASELASKLSSMFRET